MIRKVAFASSAMVAALGLAGAADAAVSFSFDAGQSGPGAGYAIVQTFNGPAGSYGLTGGSNYIIHAASPNDNTGAAPNNSNSPYLAVMANGYATYNFAAPTSSIRFDWGTTSIDNVLTVLTTAGNFDYRVPNSDIPNGPNYGVNGLLTATASSGSLITGLKFAAATNSFEVDNISAAVPEPATWGMMLLGFGLVGAVARSRRGGAVIA